MTWRSKPSKEPRKLSRWKRDNPAATSWDALDSEVKRRVKARLHRDQHGLCCYCYRQLADDNAHIEHIESRDGDNTFRWSNLALSCNGSGGQHCGHRKADARLVTIHPRRSPVPDHARMRLGGRRPGRLVAEQAAATDIEQTLNLNDPQLARSREGALRGWLNDPSARGGQASWRLASISDAHGALDALPEPAEFHPFLIAWLERRLCR